MPISPAWIQAISTIILVGVTAYYARQSRLNVRVMSQQFRQERLRYHTEVLRSRINDWLSELPRVDRTDIKAPGDVEIVGHAMLEENSEDWEGWLWVTPLMLEDDPFFHDLLENHATELRGIKDNIEDMFSRFWSLRQDFYDSYSDPPPLDDLPFPAEITEYYNLWAFERSVLLERGLSTKEDLYESIDLAIDRDRQAVRPPSKRYAGEHVPREWTSILECEVVEGDEYGDAQVMPGADDEVAAALKQVVDRLEEQDEYAIAQRAADVLVELNEEIDHLEQTLTEYRGKEIYEGDCEYIATVG